MENKRIMTHYSLMTREKGPKVFFSIYPYVYYFLFLVYKTERFLGWFNIWTFLTALLTGIASIYMLIFLLRKVFNDFNSSLSTTMILVFFLHFATIAKWFGYYYPYFTISFYIVYILGSLLFILSFKWVIGFWKGRANKYFNKMANTFSISFAVVLLLYGTATKEFSRKKTASPPGESSGLRKGPARSGHDIIWILMDEYGSNSSLQEEFGLDDPMNHELKKRGFLVLDSIRSRSYYTVYSIESLFDLDDSNEPESFYKGIDELRHSQLVTSLDNLGYKFVNLSFFDIGSNAKIMDRSGYPQNYQDQLLSGTVYEILHKWFKADSKSADSYNQLVWEGLKNEIHEQTHDNRFIWAHLLLPHEPFCRDENGKWINGPISETNPVLARKEYINYLHYGDSLVLKLIDNYIDLRNTTVIISGDHGPRFLFVKNHKNYLKPFAAIHSQGLDSADLIRIRYIQQIPLHLRY